MWVSSCSLSCHLSASSGSQSGASVTGIMQKQFRKLHCSEVAFTQERRKRRAHSCVLAHTDKTATDESEREIWRGDLGRSQKARFCQQIWTFAIMLWPDASHCFICYLIKTYEFSMAVLESYLLRRYISPTPTGFVLYRYKSRVLRKAGTWVGIVSHEHFPTFWKSPTGQVPEGHWTTWQNWWQKGGKNISGKMKLLHCPAWKVKNCHFKIACAKGGSPTLGVSSSERTTVNIAICDVPGEGLCWCKGYYSFINIWLL